MSDNSAATPLDPMLVMQQQIISTLVVQIISASRRPGGHLRDSLALLEQVAAQVLLRATDEAEDAASLAAFTDGVRQRMTSLRHPSA